MYIQTIFELCDVATSNPRRIAECLGRLWRFGGQHPTASVLYHSLEVAWMCRHMSPDAQLWALYHDAHEILTGEVPRHYKTKWMSVLQKAFDRKLKRSLGITLTESEEKQIGDFDSLCGDCELKHWDKYLWQWMGIADGLAVDEFVKQFVNWRCLNEHDRSGVDSVFRK